VYCFLCQSYLEALHNCHEDWLIRQTHKSWHAPPADKILVSIFTYSKPFNEAILFDDCCNHSYSCTWDGKMSVKLSGWVIIIIMAMVNVGCSSLQADLQPESLGLVWRSAAQLPAFVRWTEYTAPLNQLCPFIETVVVIIIIIHYVVAVKNI